MKPRISAACLLILVLLTLPAHAAAPELLLLSRYQPGMDIEGWLMRSMGASASISARA